MNRRLTNNNFHIYLKPDQLINPKTFNIHNITDKFLLDKPTFTEITDKFINYIHDTKLMIHNTTFDIDFINYKFSLLKRDIPKTNTFYKITDNLTITKKIFPNKHNNLDTLYTHYKINNNKRTLHKTLLDTQILTKIYLTITNNQTSITFTIKKKTQQQQNKTTIQHIIHQTNKLHIIFTTNNELTTHKTHLNLIQKKNKNYL